MSNFINKEELKDKVISYADKVFFYCIKRTNNRMDAEDLSQTILFEVIRNIDNGAQIENLDYYIWGVCKNKFNSYLRKTIKDRNNVEYKDEITNEDKSPTALDKLLKDEKIRTMNKAIKLLSKDYAEILYAYYIEDKSLKFISEELHMPLGTVKKRLFTIRQKLKEYLDMEKLNGKKAYVPKEYDTHRNGGSSSVNPEDYVYTLINQNLLLHSYDNPCSLEDYSLEMGISLPYIEDIVECLEHATLLKKDDNGKYLTNFIMVERETDEKIKRFIKAKAKEYSSLIIDYCKNHFNKWKELVNNPLLDDNKLMWAYMFTINRKVEYLDHTPEETLKNIRTYAHQFGDGGWDFCMSEIYDSDIKTFNINECGNGNGVIGVQRLFYPGDNNIDGVKSNALKCLKWDNCANWDADMELFGYLMKNKDIKYSDCIYTLKSSIDRMVNKNYLKIIDDKIYFNFVMLDFDSAVKSKADDYDIDLYQAKQVRKDITKEISKIFEKVVPKYLYSDLDYISSSYFIANMRQHLVVAFEEAGLIKAITDENKFVYNMFCWERK